MRAPEFWSARPGLVAGLLAPAGAAFDAAGRLRRAVARPYRARVPVICVGNLVAGGSGKTPTVLSLAAQLSAHATEVHAVARGYGGRLPGPVRVDPGRHEAASVGDEALLLGARLPCWVSRDRAAGVRAAEDAGAGIVLLDDGFQNPTVVKDFSLIAVDAGFGFGNRRVMPAGPLRERVVPGLARADAIVVIGNGAEPAGLRSAGKPILHAALEPVEGARFAGRRLVAFAGIGRPEKFFASLRGLGASLVAALPFADHHPYHDGELAALRELAGRERAALVTTAKDWVRLPRAARTGIEVLEVALRWHEPAALAALLAPLIRATSGHDLDSGACDSP
jgi:tetraacyldisaccharide 4'-kinase